MPPKRKTKVVVASGTPQRGTTSTEGCPPEPRTLPTASSSGTAPQGKRKTKVVVASGTPQRGTTCTEVCPPEPRTLLTASSSTTAPQGNDSAGVVCPTCSNVIKDAKIQQVSAKGKKH